MESLDRDGVSVTTEQGVCLACHTSTTENDICDECFSTMPMEEWVTFPPKTVNTYHVTVRRFPVWVDIVYSVEAADIEEATELALQDDGVFIEMRDGEDGPNEDIEVRHIELVEVTQ